MALTFRHQFVNAHVDTADATLAQPSNWNADHVIAGGTKGALLVFDATQTIGINSVAAVASGQVLVSAGVTTLPAWSASPTLTSMLVGDGSQSAPSWAFASETNTGLFKGATGQLAFTSAGTKAHAWDPNNYYLLSNTASIQLGASLDTILTRDAADTFAQRRGTNAQTFNLYETYTDNANYDRGFLKFTGNIFYIGTEKVGTGTLRPIRIAPGVDAWQFQTTGHFIAVFDNTYDIGLSGSNRPRDYFGAGKITTIGATGGIGYATGAGGAVTQLTSRATTVTLNTVTGDITLFSAAGSATAASFTVTNSAVAITDNIIINQKSGTDLYQVFVTNVAAGSFKVTFFTTGGVTVEQPVFHFSVIKGVSS